MNSINDKTILVLHSSSRIETFSKTNQSKLSLSCLSTVKKNTQQKYELFEIPVDGFVVG